MLRQVLVVLIGGLAYSVLQGIIGGLLLSKVPPPPADAGPFFLASSILAVALGVIVARRLPWRGWRRVAALFAISWGMQANNLAEAVFFSLDIPRGVLPLLFANSFGAAIAFAAVVDRLSPAATPANPPAEPRTPGSWIARIAACDLGYVVAYMTAGMAVWPFVQWFYSTRPLPDGRLVIAMQLLRGLVFTAIVALLARTLVLARTGRAVLAGLTLAVLGGVVPLLPPNPFMPAGIRFPHMIEVGVSNLLWGFGAALLLSASARRDSPAAAA